MNQVYTSDKTKQSQYWLVLNINFKMININFKVLKHCNNGIETKQHAIVKYLRCFLDK